MHCTHLVVWAKNKTPEDLGTLQKSRLRTHDLHCFWKQRAVSGWLFDESRNLACCTAALYGFRRVREIRDSWNHGTQGGFVGSLQELFRKRSVNELLRRSRLESCFKARIGGKLRDFETVDPHLTALDSVAFWHLLRVKAATRNWSDRNDTHLLVARYTLALQQRNLKMNHLEAWTTGTLTGVHQD